MFGEGCVPLRGSLRDRTSPQFREKQRETRHPAYKLTPSYILLLANLEKRAVANQLNSPPNIQE